MSRLVCWLIGHRPFVRLGCPIVCSRCRAIIGPHYFGDLETDLAGVDSE